jgi:SAM-dependent methyltransferase
LTSPFRCLVCAGAEAQLVYAECPDYYQGKPFRVDYHRCRACDLLQQHPLPRDLAAMYEDYPIHVRKSRLYDALRWLVMGRLYYDARSHPPGTRIVDYGCGDGSYLGTLVGKGFDLIGYETDERQAKRLSDHLGIPVHHSPNTLLAAVDGNAEVVAMHFVIEHLTDLEAGFETARRLLKPDGIFYFVVPHEHSLERRLFGKRWHNLDPPRHVSFPERAHVERLAARHGMRLEKHAPVPFPNGFAASIPVVLTGRFLFSLFALALPLGVVFSRLSPTGTHAYWLRRLP